MKQLHLKATATVLIAFSLLAGGCNTYTIPIKPDEPTATVRFVDVNKKDDKFGFLPTATAAIYLLEQSGCADLGHVSGIGNYNGHESELQVPVWKQIYFRSAHSLIVSGRTHRCELIAGLAPEAGALYEMRYYIDETKKVCNARVVRMVPDGAGGMRAEPRPLLIPPKDACTTAVSQ